ncbi:MAG: hypothetical protein IKQ37_12905 [Bacteroidaceae bacterium]|nr:hypothetical protein [Bacteroidaceae bacterium]
MKTRIFTLLMTFFAFVWSAKADEITSMKLTISHNGEPAFTQEFPSSGWEEFILSGQTTSIIISKVEVTTSGTVSDVAFLGTMYSTSQGNQSNPGEWRSYPLQNKGNGKWEFDMGEGIDLVDPGWLEQNKTKTFEFYVQGMSGSGNQLLYNNGGANYKVTFSTGESADWKIKFLEESTADLAFYLDGKGVYFSFNDDGSRTPEGQLGQLSSLAIDQFALWFRYNSGVKTNDVSLQYRVYEEGQETEGGWNRIDATQFTDMGDNTMFCNNDIIGINVTNGLEPNKNYVLEVFYQVVVDGEYFFVGKGREGSKFRFFLTEGGQGVSINSLMLTISQNGGQPEVKTLPASGCPEIFLEGEIYSLKIYGGSAMADESIQNMMFYATMYNTEDGGPWSGEDWDVYPLTYQGGGEWTVSLPEPQELISSDWKLKHRQKTFEFYVKGQDQNGNDVYYNNDWQNYKVTFTCGEGSSSTGPIKSFKLTINCDGEVFTESFPSEGWPQHYIEGQVSSIKVMRAEVETDETMSDLVFSWTIYDEADGWQHDESAWGWVNLMGGGGGHWEYEWGKGMEFVESEWLTDIKTKTLEFLVSGKDSEGNLCKYNNGINAQGYDNNYKVTFTTGIDPDGVRLIPASKADGATYNLAGQRVGKDYKGIVVTGGRKVLVK